MGGREVDLVRSSSALAYEGVAISETSFRIDVEEETDDLEDERFCRKERISLFIERISFFVVMIDFYEVLIDFCCWKNLLRGRFDFDILLEEDDESFIGIKDGKT